VILLEVFFSGVDGALHFDNSRSTDTAKSLAAVANSGLQTTESDRTLRRSPSAAVKSSRSVTTRSLVCWWEQSSPGAHEVLIIFNDNPLVSAKQQECSFGALLLLKKAADH